MAEDLEQDLGADDNMDAHAAAFNAIFSGEPPKQEEESPAAPQPAAQPETPAPVAAQPETPAAPAPQASAPQTPSQPSQPAPQAPAPSQPADATAAKSQIEATLTFAKGLVGSLQAQLMGEFSDVKSQEDVYKLMEAPERYNRFVIAVTKIQNAQGQVAQLEQQHKQAEATAKQEQDANRAKAREAEGQRLGELLPDLKDKEKGPKLVADLRDYANKIGVKPERMADYTADEFVALHKAMQFDAAKAAEASALEAANKKAAKAPPVQQPGTRVSGDAKAEKAQEHFDQLAKTGRVDDAAKVFASILG